MAISCLVPEYIVLDLFNDLRIFEQIRGGCLNEREIHEQTRPAKMCDGVSYFTRIEEPSGEFVARVHYVQCIDPLELHIYPTAIRVGDVNVFRSGHQERPPDAGQSTRAMRGRQAE